MSSYAAVYANATAVRPLYFNTHTSGRRTHVYPELRLFIVVDRYITKYLYSIYNYTWIMRFDVLGDERISSNVTLSLLKFT